MIVFIDNEEFLTIDEVENLVAQKAGTIDMKVRFGAFPKPIKLKVRKFWKRKDIEEYIEKMRKKQKNTQLKIDTYLQKFKRSDIEEYLKKKRDKEEYEEN